MSQGEESQDAPAAESGGVTFSQLPLSKAVHKAVTTIGYETPTPVQAQAIPHLLEGRDLLGVADTGTGKTAAFALPLLSNIQTKTNALQVLCLAPTRELAIQVAEAFQSYAKFVKGFHVLPVYGGAGYGSQIRHLERGVHVVVGTPGRVMDHMRRGVLSLEGLQTLVLDEADEMLNMGFIEDIEWILEQIPEPHQTALFSATMPPRIKSIAEKYLREPATITIKSKAATAPAIRQRFIQVRNIEKLDVLTRVLEVEEFDGMLIFVRTKNATLEVAERLQARGYAAEALNGDIAQNQREKTVARLRSGNIDVLVATDVAARGLDVDRISHVINYDMPYDTESYVHRIGRTGRAGREGDAILFMNRRETRMFQALERATGKPIERFKFPTVDMLNDRKIEQLFARIDEALQQDLKEYNSVVKKYLKRNDIDPALLAAAIASLEAGGKPFYIKEAPKPPRPERHERPERRGNRERGRPRRDGVAMDGYRLEVGESHGVSKGDIVGAIANEAGIDSRDMGKIRMFNKHSFIDLPEGMPKETFQLLQKVCVRGQQLRISRDSGKRPIKRKPRRHS